MLSYQHLYHAGGPADLHKHSVLCAVLDDLRRRYRALSYMETHAGRGLYDLAAAESVKTGEAALGWLAPDAADRVPAELAGAVFAVNGGDADGTFYPGSPLVAAHLLRPQDSLHLCELHPQEYAALEKAVAGDERVTLYHQDGYESVIKLSPPLPRRGLVLVDPSYEIKDEYLQVAGFIDRLRRVWPDGAVLLWYPLLPAARHEAMKTALAKTQPDVLVHEYCWTVPEGSSGMYGSGMIALNCPGALPGFSSL
ncbi:MAG: 23S rRNA (adenine(2030)-N(6))-methyltransferase RlmJ [Rhodospirillales bacterium]|nr:23S rRNA (adenine(2030)-N(6))-methyltransferase RlmJ [Rhodospirillales bacterium]